FESEHNFDDDDGDESEEEELSNRLMTDESTEAQDEPDNGDDTNIQNIQQHYHRQNNNKPMIVDNKSKVKAKEKMVHQQRNFQSEFNQLRTDVTDAISKLSGRIDGHHDQFQRQFKSFSKAIQQTTINSTLEKFQRDGEIFDSIVEYNGQNLLDIHDAGDCGRFARTVLKNLFTSAEMSRSILYSYSIYTKPGLDPVRMKSLNVNAIRARFRISESYWNEFFKCCLQRTLTQFLCDVRRKYEREQQQTHQVQQQENDSSENDY
ncbi:unnamed protein product, partial [Rotaria sp. Silwood2]